MNDFLSTFSDSEYQGCVGMEMAKRPNSGGAGTASDDRFTEESLELAEETKEKYSLYKRIDELNQELSSIKNKSKEMSTESGPEYIQKHRT